MGVYIPYTRLPSAYQEVEYIQNSGNLYINSGYAPNQDTKAELKFSNWTESGSNDVFGTDKNFANSGFTLLPTVPCYGNQTIDVAKNVGDGNLHTITLGKDGYVVDGELITTFNTQTFTSLNLYLFALNRNGGAREYAHYRFYYMKIWDNGTLVRDFVPCYRKSDSVIGLYDLVNSVFYTNSGTGTFSKGNNVTMSELQNAYIGDYTGLPSAYQEVEWIGSSGSQYINTGFIPTVNTSIVTSLSLGSNSGWAVFFGVTGNDSSSDGVLGRIYADTSGSFNPWFCNTNYEETIAYISTDVFHSIELSANTLYIDGNSYTITTTGTPYQSSMDLFAGNNGGSHGWRKSSCKIKSFTIEDSGNTVRDFIPCYRIADGVIGMYDVVNDVFYTNSGSGTFTKGPDVN